MNPLFSALVDAFSKVTGAWLYFIGSEVVIVTSAVSLLLAQPPEMSPFDEPEAVSTAPDHSLIAYILLGFVLLRALWLMVGLFFAGKAAKEAAESE